MALQVVEVLVAQEAAPGLPEGQFREPTSAAALPPRCPQRVVAVVHRHLTNFHWATTGQPQANIITLYRALFHTLLNKYALLYIEY